MWDPCVVGDSNPQIQVPRWWYLFGGGQRIKLLVAKTKFIFYPSVFAIFPPVFSLWPPFLAVDTRLSRRVVRDVALGRDLDAILHVYTTMVKPAFEEFAEPVGISGPPPLSPGMLCWVRCSFSFRPALAIRPHPSLVGLAFLLGLLYPADQEVRRSHHPTRVREHRRHRTGGAAPQIDITLTDLWVVVVLVHGNFLKNPAQTTWYLTFTLTLPFPLWRDRILTGSAHQADPGNC